jgi:AAA+ ATPase superfamily predicted ATPase
MQEINPFVFSRPVDAADLIDRDEEAGKLLALAEGSHATRLSAPRRYGKTSLLRRVGQDAERAGLNYVEVDFYGVLSHGDVARRLEKGYRAIRSGPRRAADAAIRALRPRVSVGAGPLRIEGGSPAEASREAESRILMGLLDLPLELFERTGTRTLVAFDEFQALLTVSPQIDGLFRSHIQRHGDAASYIFAGSHPGLMEQLFGAYERPFFGQARVMRLDPLTDSDLVEYVGERFERGERDAMPVMSAFLDLAKGHPQRAMLLAHQLWDQTPRGEVATPERWQQALAAVFSEYAEALQAAWDSLEAKEQAVLAALALGQEPLFSERTLSRFNLSKGGAQHARDALARSGQLHKVGDRWQLVDPLLAEWIVRLEFDADAEATE